jgi:hypothetical protein
MSHIHQPPGRVIRGKAVDAARDATREAKPWIERLARVGFVAKAVQYGTIGLLAALAAVGDSDGRTTDSKGVLNQIHRQPFGQVLLGLMAFGLAGYALWRFVEAILDPEHRGHGATGALKRIGKLCNGVLHAGLVVYAVGLLTGASGGSQADGTKSWTAQLMSWPAGPWLVGAAGVGLVVFAGAQIKQAWSSKLDEHLDLGRMSARLRTCAVQLSRFGIAARAVVFALVGGFLVTAAFRTDPNRAKGLGDALASVLRWRFGDVVLAVIALGLVAYGVYEVVEAKYRRIQAA